MGVGIGGLALRGRRGTCHGSAMGMLDKSHGTCHGHNYNTFHEHNHNTFMLATVGVVTGGALFLSLNKLILEENKSSNR